MPPPRTRTTRPRPLPRNQHRAGIRTQVRRENSVKFRQSASSDSGLHERRPRNAPDLRENLNLNRDIEAYQSDLRERLNNQRGQARPNNLGLGYHPVGQLNPVVDPAQERLNQLEAALRAVHQD